MIDLNQMIEPIPYQTSDEAREYLRVALSSVLSSWQRVCQYRSDGHPDLILAWHGYHLSLDAYWAACRRANVETTTRLTSEECKAQAPAHQDDEEQAAIKRGWEAARRALEEKGVELEFSITEKAEVKNE